MAKGNTRVTGLEQYYTPANLAKALAEFMVNDVGCNPAVSWLEPAAGTGAFVDGMRAAGVGNVISMDIDPQRSDIVKADFLESTPQGSGMVCLTNPPFGRNHSLSIPFFKKAAESCDYIAFIVPRSWRKWSIVNRLPRNFNKIIDLDLGVSYVDKNGVPLSKSSALSTIFQVWERSSTPRPLYGAVPTKHFKVVDHLNAKASLTIFGRGCGTLKTTFPPAPNTTQMFIDATPAILTAIDAIDFSPFFTQVAYTEALSFVEINYAIENWLTTGKQLDENFLVKSTLAPSSSIPLIKQIGNFK